MNRKSDRNTRTPGKLLQRVRVWQVLGLLAVALVGVTLAQDDKPTVINAEAAKLKNPQPSDAANIEAGREIYLTHCASCHGKTGKGDGGQALGGGTPSDLTDDSWDFGATDGEIYWVIREGIETNADMLAYKKTLTEKDMWQLVVFIRSIGTKKK